MEELSNEDDISNELIANDITDIQSSEKDDINYSINISRESVFLPLNTIPQSHNEEVKLLSIKKDSIKYIGETKGNLPDGFGICIYQNYTYKGYWKQGKKEGWGSIIFTSQPETVKAYFIHDQIEGYCQKTHNNQIITGEYSNGKFSSVLIVENNDNHQVYEGEVISKDKTVAVGKLYNKKNDTLYFLGEIKNYNKEHGYGLFAKKNSFVYIGQCKHRRFHGYVEIYFVDGKTLFSNVVQGKKNGFSSCVFKDLKTSFGKFVNNLKHGPFISYVKSSNITKPTIKMELYLYGFKCKTIDKIDTAIKYVKQNYPEYESLLSIQHQTLIDKVTKIIKEERDDNVKYALALSKEDTISLKTENNNDSKISP